ncbi:prolipoprotein diacylglyceryl transferase [Rubritalea marina]|uniref:prolipoprotein diacylglyceryl transferase n=1 Tax=Rubritalea marina TaxID=361055 RepID=UPI0003626900|nr:prolipoprotein diacylglyceryl transferase [Rubritalea marina]
MIATYIHDLNPVILEITDTLKLRWYGLAYLLAFVCGYLLLKFLGDRKLWVLPGKVAGDFIAYAAIFGVFLGGRIGSVVFYNWDSFVADPLSILRVWDGGMASHGGILGLMIFTFIYAKKHHLSWTGLGDGLCVVAPLGIMFGRIANFINGELYGRIDRSFHWAMKFPNTLWDSNMVESKSAGLSQQVAAHADAGGEYAVFYQQLLDSYDHYIEGAYAEGSPEHLAFLELNQQKVEMLNQAIRENEVVREAVGNYLEPRYPSQLFQAALEGLALFAILFTLRITWRKAPHGALTGLFFILYAIFRISMEQFREPEISGIRFLGGSWTMGQFLSLFMIAIGVGFLIRAFTRKEKV